MKNKTKYLKIISCIIISVIVITAMCFFQLQNKNNNNVSIAIENIEIIQSLEKEIKSSLGEDFVYSSIAGDVIVDRISKKLSFISDYITSIDEVYNQLNRSCKKKIDDYINQQTICRNWNEYKQFLKDYYLISNTPEESANQLAEEVGYSSADEYFSSQKTKGDDLMIDNVNYTLSNDKYKVTGTVTNNTSYVARFIKVKISLVDKNGNVLNTDNTYACGDEGLASGESTTFECYVDRVDGVSDVKVVIYDYQ